MKEYYIYLTVVHHPKLGDLYYAGKHKSEGPEKDKKYHGSCCYKYWNRWLQNHEDWFDTTILDWFDNPIDQSKAESLLIQDCLRKYGARLYGTYTKKGTYRSWLDQFGKGTCLNGHWNDCAAALVGSQTSESRAKARQSLIDNGTLQKCIDAMHTPEAVAKAVQTRIENGSTQKSVNAMHTPEAIAKNRQIRIENGSLQKFQQAGTEAAKDPDVQARALKTRIENGSQQKAQQAATKAAQKSMLTKYNWFFNGKLVYVGNKTCAGRKMKALNQVWDRSKEPITNN